jgi:ATP-binding cassette subfamily A (ABC1) protein 3
LSLNLNKNEIFCLLGQNGAGKTTTISMLTGMLEATSGKVACFGKTLIDSDLHQTKLIRDIEYIRQKMGICPQQDLLFE